MMTKDEERKATTLHRKAMVHAHRADDEALRALRFEKEAAEMMPVSPDSEPTRSILYRSAAWLAVQAGCFDEAEQLAERGLSEHSDGLVAQELREVRVESKRRTVLKNRGKAAGALGLCRASIDLLNGDIDSDDTESWMVEIHKRIAGGDAAILYELEAIAAGIIDPDAIDSRGLALEALATMHSPALFSRVETLALLLLASGEDSLRFEAISAIFNGLPEERRRALLPVIVEAVGGFPDESSARRIGLLFIEQHSETSAEPCRAA